MRVEIGIGIGLDEPESSVRREPKIEPGVIAQPERMKDAPARSGKRAQGAGTEPGAAVMRAPLRAIARVVLQPIGSEAGGRAARAPDHQLDRRQHARLVADEPDVEVAPLNEFLAHRGPAAPATLPGNGALDVQGTARATPLGSELRARVSRVDLGFWLPYLELPLQFTGMAETDLTLDVASAAGADPVGGGGVTARVPDRETIFQIDSATAEAFPADLDDYRARFVEPPAAQSDAKDAEAVREGDGK